MADIRPSALDPAVCARGVDSPVHPCEDLIGYDTGRERRGGATSILTVLMPPLLHHLCLTPGTVTGYVCRSL